MFSTSREKSCKYKTISFLLSEKCVSTSRDEELLGKYLMQWKKWFPLARKWVSTIKNKSIFKKWFTFISVTVSASRKELSSKADSFQEKENPPIAGMKDSLKNTFPLDGRKLMFVLARKPVSTTRNEVFIEKYVSTIRKNCCLWKKIENGFH